MRANIVLLPGDGIGPEVVAEARRILERVAEKFGHQFVFSEHLVGGLDWFHARTEWYHGDEQVLNFVNAGVTAHW